MAPQDNPFSDGSTPPGEERAGTSAPPDAPTAATSGTGSEGGADTGQPGATSGPAPDSGSEAVPGVTAAETVGGTEAGDGTGNAPEPATGDAPEAATGDAPEAATGESEEVSDDGADASRSGAPPAPPTFGLMFKAPEPAPAPSTRERPVDDADSQDEESGGGSGRRRRRRGGRGRRPREAGEAAESATDADGTDKDRSDKDRSGNDDGAEQEATDGAAKDSTDGTDTGKASGKGSGKGTSKGTSKGTKKGSGRGAKKASGTSDGESADEEQEPSAADETGAEESASSTRRRRRRRRGGSGGEGEDPPGTVTKVREPRSDRSEPTGVKGSTRLEAKKQRRREGREAGRRRTIITEAEFLARRESVERVMVVRGTPERTQIGVLEDGVLVEHYVSRETSASMAGNVYLGRVQNVLPSMEAAFVDIGRGRNAVLYAGEVNWDAAGLETNQPKRIENALSSGDTVLVQVTKDPIGHKGARLTSQVSLPGRYLVYVPEGNMTGISRKLPDTERARLKQILKEVVPDTAGVIVRTAAEGASEEELRKDVERLTTTWQKIQDKATARKDRKASAGGAPTLLYAEPDLTVRVIRDVFNEDFSSLVVSGERAWDDVSGYVSDVAPDLSERVTRWTSEEDVFAHYRIDEQIAKAMDRKVWLPSGGSLVIDRTEAMTVIDVNTGKFVGSGGNLEETVTKNNIEAAEEIVRQLRLRDIGGIIVIDFIDMVLESNRELVVRRLLECLGRDRTKHQVAEVTSLGLVQMTRKRVGSGLIEVFSEPCEHCNGRGIIVHSEPVDRAGGDQNGQGGQGGSATGRGKGRRKGGSGTSGSGTGSRGGRSGDAADTPERVEHGGPTPAQIAAAAHAAALKSVSGEPVEDDGAVAPVEDVATAPSDTAPSGTAPSDTAPASAVSGSGAGPESSAESGGPADDTRPDAGAETGPEAGTEEAAEAETTASRTTRKRRPRGRVTAPAGPPRVSSD